MSNQQPLTVMITTADRVQAGTIAELLVEMRLAACVQILPGVMSIYRWDDAIQRAEEAVLLVKTTAGAFDQLEETVRAQHSYETPEIVAFPITHASGPYIQWLIGNVDGAEE